MSVGRPKLGKKQELAIAALLTSATNAEAAAKCQISEACLQRWLLLPEFKQAYREARQAVLDGSIALLQQYSTDSVKALLRNLTCGVPSAEIKAALGILDQGFRGLELLDLAERLAALEAEREEVAVAPANEKASG